MQDYEIYDPNQNHINGPNNESWGFGGYIAVSVLELLCCGIIWGILGILFSVQANDAHKAGNMIEFEKKKRYARNCLIAGPIIAVAYLLFKVLLV